MTTGQIYVAGPNTINIKMTKVSKGRRVENLAKDIMKAEGWLVDKKVRTRFSSPDFFGQFDLLCIKGAETVYIQVKSNISDFYTARKEISAWLISKNLLINAQIWLYQPRKEWRKENLPMTLQVKSSAISVGIL